MQRPSWILYRVVYEKGDGGEKIKFLNKNLEKYEQEDYILCSRNLMTKSEAIKLQKELFKSTDRCVWNLHQVKWHKAGKKSVHGLLDNYDRVILQMINGEINNSTYRIYEGFTNGSGTYPQKQIKSFVKCNRHFMRKKDLQYYL